MSNEDFCFCLNLENQVLGITPDRLMQMPRYILLICFMLLFRVNTVVSQIIGLDILGSDQQLEIPFEFQHDYIILKVKVDDKITLRFMFDTGAEHIILFEKYIGDLLGFEYDDKIKILGSDLTQEVGALISRNVSIKLKNTDPVIRDVLVLERNYLKLEELTGIDLDGILGAGCFKNLVVRIDYKKKKLILYHPDSFVQQDTEAQEISLSIEQQKPYFSSKVVNQDNDTLMLKLLLDTGAALAFLLNTDSHENLQLPSKVIKGNLGLGIGGFIEGYLGKIPEFNMGDFRFSNILTNFQLIDSSMLEIVEFRRNGLVGNTLLSRFEVTIDYMRKKLYLKPRKNFDKAFEYDKSGLFLLAYGENLDQFIVNYVVEGSPAQDAGILKGDIIKKVGCWSSKYYDLHKLTRKLSAKEGKTIRLKLLRGDESYKTKFKLRDMLNQAENSIKL